MFGHLEMAFENKMIDYKTRSVRSLGAMGFVWVRDAELFWEFVAG